MEQERCIERLASLQDHNSQKGTNNNAMSNYKKQSKVDSGDNSNLPDSIRLVAKPRSDVVAWTRFDPALNAEMQNYVCNRTFGECKPLLCVG